MEEPRSQEREATAEEWTTGQKANLKTAQPACVRHGGKAGRHELREGRKETWTGTCPSQTLIEARYKGRPGWTRQWCRACCCWGRLTPRLSFSAEKHLPKLSSVRGHQADRVGRPIPSCSKSPFRFRPSGTLCSGVDCESGTSRLMQFFSPSTPSLLAQEHHPFTFFR